MLTAAIKLLFSAHVFEIAAIGSAGFGVSFALAPERSDVHKAHYFFMAATILTLGRVAQFISTWEHQPKGLKYAALFVAWGVTGVAWLATYQWVEGKLAPVEPKTPPFAVQVDVSMISPSREMNCLIFIAYPWPPWQYLVARQCCCLLYASER